MQNLKTMKGGNGMKKIFFVLTFFACFMTSSAQASLLNLNPGTTLFADSGPFGHNGRGVIFRAEEDFAMTSLGMDLQFPGTLDFAVDVYNVSGTTRGALVSSTPYSSLTDDGSAFFTLAHNQNFSQNNIYELMFRFSDPGVIFPHYNFNNSSLTPANGFSVGSELLVLDGSDFASSGFGNQWLANFELTTTTTSSSNNAIPEPATMLLVGFGMAGAFVRRRFSA